MKFGLIICTFKRPAALEKLLESVTRQQLHPEEILVVDGSPGNETREMIKKKGYPNLQYYKVREEDRGLTRQRNYGISRTGDNVDVICFLDDDTVLEPEYFEHLIGTYHKYSDAVGVGGYIVDEVEWKRAEQPAGFDEFWIDGYKRKIGSRNLLRKKLGLLSNRPPGVMPEFSNGLSIGFLPPTGKTYPVEFFMGGVASYRKELFEQISFSNYFVGYGLYEDMDFCLRASRIGQLYVNTAACLYHYHENSGRPNRFDYGKMVVRNGWYVWRVKYQSPSLKSRMKWNSIALILTVVRIGNIISTTKRKEAFTESLGRIVGWFSLIFDKPVVGSYRANKIAEIE
ncbi:glycosyltransferase family 2 protein [Salinimicrobium sp. CDJ15-81-2]|nr:glycosyltransferase family 2 protein [Salinimicrobium nanhaiense]